MRARVFIGLLLTLVLAGCANLVLPGTNRIWEERTATAATARRSLVMSDSLDWFAQEGSDRYEIWLPPGTYHVQAEDSDYWYFKAPERVSVGKTKFLSKLDSRTYDGGIYFSKKTNPKAHPSGAYIDYEGGRKLLLYAFDFRFASQEGKRWHFVDE